MANPTVEKLQALGIRHGEKAVVALVSALCLLCLFWAITKPTIDTTPDEVKKAADAAQQNIRRTQPEDTILAKLDQENLVDPGFEKVVDARKVGGADAEPYRLAGPLAIPEPGAGLMRDAPVLLAVNYLDAHTGRGSAMLLVVDDEGNLVYEKPKADEKPKFGRKKKKKRSPMGGMMGGGMGGGGMGGMMGGMGGNNSRKKARDRRHKAAEKERTRRREEEEERRKILGVGGRGAAEATPAEQPEEAPPEGEEKKDLKGLRWVALMGTLDHKKLREHYARALKVDMANANPHYLRLDVERQELQDEGSWTEWAKVDREKIDDEVLGLLTEVDPEPTPENVRIKELVDPLPFLEIGYWLGVHPIELLPKDYLTPKKKENEKSKGGGGVMGPGMSADEMMKRMGGMSNADYGSQMKGMNAGTMKGMSAMMGASGAGGGGGGAIGGPAEGDFTKTDSDRIFVRSIDFTVEPEQAYRYRVRLVVRNPNYHVENVNPGVDTESKELFGPWSATTDQIDVPGDVSVYVMKKTPKAGAERRGDVQFEVVKFAQDTGLTIVRNFNQAPGQIIGGVLGADIPKDDLEGTRNVAVDFTSHRLLIDTAGGDRDLDDLGLGGLPLEVPALALIVRPDGRLVLHDQARDHNNGEMVEMKKIYDATLDDARSSTEKKSSSMMGGMMGGGMMGGMMPTGGR